jgi:hypothetical protein
MHIITILHSVYYVLGTERNGMALLAGRENDTWSDLICCFTYFALGRRKGSPAIWPRVTCLSLSWWGMCAGCPIFNDVCKCI